MYVTCEPSRSHRERQLHIFSSRDDISSSGSEVAIHKFVCKCDVDFQGVRRWESVIVSETENRGRGRGDGN